MDTMLRQALRKHRELRNQFENCLLGEDGDRWEAEARKFLAKRPCWSNLQVGGQVTEPRLIIDCDADPFLPAGWRVEEHRQGGQLEWTKSLINLYLADGQKNGQWLGGHELRAVLKNQPVLNANMLDFLLKYPQLIPEEWKNGAVFFWGTIYRDSAVGLYVRCLYWGGGRWFWSWYPLGVDWDASHPAAVRAS